MPKINFPLAALFSNHSTKHPNGILDKGTLKSFFAITEHPDGSLTYQKGYERIPDNWYRRPLGEVNAYSPASFAIDFAQVAAAVPEAASVGGNTGTVNSFAGVDLGDITGGAYHTSDLLNPKKFVCFFYQLTLAVVPDFLRSEALGTSLAAALKLLHSQVDPFVDPSCAKIGKTLSRSSARVVNAKSAIRKLQRRIFGTIPRCSCQSSINKTKGFGYWPYFIVKFIPGGRIRYFPFPFS